MDSDQQHLQVDNEQEDNQENNTDANSQRLQQLDNSILQIDQNNNDNDNNLQDETEKQENNDSEIQLNQNSQNLQFQDNKPIINIQDNHQELQSEQLEENNQQNIIEKQISNEDHLESIQNENEQQQSNDEQKEQQQLIEGKLEAFETYQEVAEAQPLTIVQEQVSMNCCKAQNQPSPLKIQINVDNKDGDDDEQKVQESLMSVKSAGDGDKIKKINQQLMLQQASMNSKDQKIKELQDFIKKQKILINEQNQKQDLQEQQLQQKIEQLKLQYDNELKQLKEDQKQQIQQLKLVEQEKEKIHGKQVESLEQRIKELEKQLKEKENDLEQYRNGNQTLHLQDVSAISMHNNNHLKSNQNNDPKKDLTIYEVLNEKHSTADLSDMGHNFWLISAEQRVKQNNPLYKDYIPKKEEDQGNKKKSVNIPTKKYEKSYWFKYVDIPKRKPQIQLPKIQDLIKEHSNERLQKSPPKQIPYSQKLLANNQALMNSNHPNHIQYQQQQKQQIMYNSQPQLIKKEQYPYDPDDFIADQELQKLFNKQSVTKDQLIQNYALPDDSLILQQQYTNTSQVTGHREKYPFLSQKQSYEYQYQHRRDVQNVSRYNK